MESIAAARALLERAARPGGTAPLLHALGFAEPPARLAAADLALLGIDGVRAQVSRGPGALRALVVDLPPDATPRETIARIARELAARVPHLLWLVVARPRETGSIVLATWERRPSGVRVAALTIENGRATASDAEALCALAGCAGVAGPDVVRHARWIEVLGREVVTRRFFLALRDATESIASSVGDGSAEVREIALLTVCRLLFLSFLETKGWLDGDFGFLVNTFSRCAATGGGYHRRVLAPLLFGTLNTPARKRAPAARAFGRIPFLNGGLFTRTPLERRHARLRFPDDAFAALFERVLTRFRFTVREDADGWSESAVDPEILGRTFESLMHTPARRDGGVYYTPTPFVTRIVDGALAAVLEYDGRAPDAAPEECAAALRRISELRVLDPACGSGSMLVAAAARLASLREALGDARPRDTILRETITTSIHGVDLHCT